MLCVKSLHPKTNTIDLLLACNRTDVNARDVNGDSVLMYAVCGGNLRFIKRVLSAGTGAAIVDVDATNNRGDTALHVAANKLAHTWLSDAVTLLVQAGANPHLRDARNHTPFDIIVNKTWAHSPPTILLHVHRTHVAYSLARVMCGWGGGGPCRVSLTHGYIQRMYDVIVRTMVHAPSRDVIGALVCLSVTKSGEVFDARRVRKSVVQVMRDHIDNPSHACYTCRANPSPIAHAVRHFHVRCIDAIGQSGKEGVKRRASGLMPHDLLDHLLRPARDEFLPAVGALMCTNMDLHAPSWSGWSLLEKVIAMRRHASSRLSTRRESIDNYLDFLCARDYEAMVLVVMRMHAVFACLRILLNGARPVSSRSGRRSVVQRVFANYCLVALVAARVPDVITAVVPMTYTRTETLARLAVAGGSEASVRQARRLVVDAFVEERLPKAPVCVMVCTECKDAFLRARGSFPMIFIAANNNHVGCIGVIGRHGVDLRFRGETALVWRSCGWKLDSTWRALLDADADPNARCESLGYTALTHIVQRALRGVYSDITAMRAVRELVAHGASVFIRGHDDKTVLDVINAKKGAIPQTTRLLHQVSACVTRVRRPDVT